MAASGFKETNSDTDPLGEAAVEKRPSIDRIRPLGAVMGKPRDLQRRTESLAPMAAALAERGEAADFLARDNVDIPALEDREGYNPDFEFMYWLTGYADYAAMKDQLPELLSRDLMFLDFGGCTGRVTRHFLTARPKSQATIAEVNVNYVNWVNTYFGENCRGLRVGPTPIIPVSDNAFDFAYGISVFTHIDHDEISWLKELVRVVKPQGRIYLTILSEHSWATMDKAVLLSIIKSEHEYNSNLASAVGGPMPAERISVQLEFGGLINNCNTFHSSAYIHRVWGQFATVERIVFGGHGEQTAVILRNNVKPNVFGAEKASTGIS
jgi:SAM-dependent methyltransferase